MPGDTVLTPDTSRVLFVVRPSSSIAANSLPPVLSTTPIILAIWLDDRSSKEYVDKWTGTASVVRKVVRVYWVPVERPALVWNYSVVLGVDLLTFHHSSPPGHAKSIRVPPAG